MKRFLQWWRAVATRRELHGLSDHQLRDLGLTRTQVEALYR